VGPLPACAIAASSIEDSRTLLGLRDDALDRISADAEPILRELRE